MTITLGVNMIAQQMRPFFSTTFWVLPICIFHFSMSRPSKFNSIYMPNMTTSSLFTQISFSYRKVGNFWHVKCFHCTKKLNFPLRISSVNVTKSTFSCGFGYIFWRNPSWKTSIFVQCLFPIWCQFGPNPKDYFKKN